MNHQDRSVLGTFAILALATGTAPAQAQNLSLVPAPQRLERRVGSTQLDGTWRVRVVADSPESVGAGGLLSDVHQKLGWSWQLGQGSRHTVVIRPRPPFGTANPLLESQGYDLRVERDSIVVAAPTATGRFYGVQTLRQLVRGSASATLPRISIRDYPELRWRGVSDDISRGQASTLADFRATLEHLGIYKINLYCLYLEDMARFWSAPEVGVDRGALTPSELRLIVEEAHRYHITVVPIFQTLGHQERLLGYPEFRRLAEQQPPTGLTAWVQRMLWTLLPAAAQAWGIKDPSEAWAPPTCFSPVLPETRKRVIELIDEVAASVPSPFFHLGGDEPSDLGLGTSRVAVAKRGLGSVYAGYMGALSNHVAGSLQRQPMIFSDVLLQDSLALATMPKNVAVVDWHYDPSDSGSSLRRLQDAGFRSVFASPGLWNWLGIHPDYGRAFPNIANLARAAQRHGSLGLVVSSWGDGGAESLRRANWTGYAYAADASWHTPGETEEFLGRFAAVEFGIRSPALARVEQLVGWQTFPTIRSNQRLFHAKPRLRTHSTAWLERMTSLEHDMGEARELVAAALPTVKFGRARLDVLDHTAARFQYAARRELTLEALASVLIARSWTSLDDQERAQTLSAISGLRDSSLAIARRYEELWRRDNRRPMLSPLLARLRQQTEAWDTMMAAAHSGVLRPE